MYATAGQILSMNNYGFEKTELPRFVSNMLNEPYIPPKKIEKFEIKQEVPQLQKKPEIKEYIQGKWSKKASGTTLDPKIWGPAFWFTLHVSAAHYPLQASPIVRERMKNRILALPYEIPCQTCRSHASSFIESHRDALDSIVSGRHSLGKFYVNFHNKVNERYGKPTWTYDQAYKFYSGNAEIEHLSYS